jgi:hypothetical protein
MAREVRISKPEYANWKIFKRNSKVWHEEKL